MNTILFIIFIVLQTICIAVLINISKNINQFKTILKKINNFSQKIQKNNDQITKAININEKINNIKLNNFEIMKELELTEIFFNNIKDAIIIFNNEKEIISVNKGFTELTGYSESEVINKDIEYVINPINEENNIKNIFIKSEELNTYKEESINRTKTGIPYPSLITISAVFDEEQKSITHYVAILRDITKEKEDELKLIKEAREDKLTKLENRASYDKKLISYMHSSFKEKYKFGVFFIDLDKFKLINDNYGHLAGDEVLVEVGKRLKSVIRDSDTVFRIGGDEFSIIALPVRNQKELELIKNKALKKLCGPFNLKSGDVINISGSIGYALYPDNVDIKKDNTDVQQQLYEFADKQMYAEKTKNRS